MKGKILIAVTIILSSLIGSGFYYATQQSRQQSIEKQQQLKIEQEQLKLQKESSSKRKKDCYAIYDKERTAYNNTKNMYYYPLTDKCIISYKQKVNKKKWCYSDDKRNTSEKVKRYVLKKNGKTEKDILNEEENERLEIVMTTFNLCRDGYSMQVF